MAYISIFLIKSKHFTLSIECSDDNCKECPGDVCSEC